MRALDSGFGAHDSNSELGILGFGPNIPGSTQLEVLHLFSVPNLNAKHASCIMRSLSPPRLEDFPFWAPEIGEVPLFPFDYNAQSPLATQPHWLRTWMLGVQERTSPWEEF